MFVTLLVAVLIIVTMIGINALYVAGEFASVSARKSRIQQMAESGNQLARMLLPIIEDRHRLDNYIAASQVGITLSSIVLGIYGQQQLAPRLAPLLQRIPFLNQEVVAAGVAATLVLLFLTTLQVVLGELVPKSIALQYPERIALATVLPMRWSAELILKPLIILLNGSGSLILRLLGASYGGGHGHIHSPEEIQLLIGESFEGGLLDAEDRRLLDNAFRVGELTAGEIAVPRTRMVAASVDTPLPELLKLAAESDYTRIPVYENDIDHVIGFVHLKDLFKLTKTQPQASANRIVRVAPYVPETMLTNDVWETLNRERSYIAFVFDEYGGTVGMITREDVIEELFGEVQDEFDSELAPIVKVGERQYLVRGDLLVEYVNDRLAVDLPVEFANTIGGLILHTIGRVAEVGDEASVNGVMLRVQATTGTSIDQVRLTLPPQTPNEPDPALEAE
jgi:CBS domain containing-hemolysin-like protein